MTDREETGRELLPCPFCNSPASMTVWIGGTTGRKFYRVYCDAPNPPGCPVEPFTDNEAQEKAASDWNRRAAITPTTEKTDGSR